MQPTHPSTPNLSRAIIGGALLFLLDAILMNQGVLSAIIGLVILLVAIPKATFGRNTARRAHGLKKSAIWLFAVFCVFTFNWANNRMAQNRASDVIAAVNAYHQKTGAYPKTLNTLVPTFLAAVPRAKYTLIFGEFRYFYNETNPVLFYVSDPPFGRPTFYFGQGRWGYVD